MRKPTLQAMLMLFGALLISSGESQARYLFPHVEELADAAYRFHKAARHAHHAVFHFTGHSHVTESARELARAARHYRRMVKSRRGLRHQRRAFEILNAHYRDFRHHYRHAGLHETREQRRAMRRLGHRFRHLKYEHARAHDRRREYRTREGLGADHGRWSRNHRHEREWIPEVAVIPDDGA